MWFIFYRIHRHNLLVLLLCTSVHLQIWMMILHVIDKSMIKWITYFTYLTSGWAWTKRRTRHNWINGKHIKFVITCLIASRVPCSSFTFIMSKFFYILSPRQVQFQVTFYPSFMHVHSSLYMYLFFKEKTYFITYCHSLGNHVEIYSGLSSIFSWKINLLDELRLISRPVALNNDRWHCCYCYFVGSPWPWRREWNTWSWWIIGEFTSQVRHCTKKKYMWSCKIHKNTFVTWIVCAKNLFLATLTFNWL